MSHIWTIAVEPPPGSICKWVMSHIGYTERVMSHMNVSRYMWIVKSWHIWMSHVTYMIHIPESWHIEWVMVHMHATCPGPYEWVMSHTQTRRHRHRHKFKHRQRYRHKQRHQHKHKYTHTHTYTYIWIRHVMAHMNDSCYDTCLVWFGTCEWVMSHIRMYHTTQIIHILVAEVGGWRACKLLWFNTYGHVVSHTQSCHTYINKPRHTNTNELWTTHVTHMQRLATRMCTISENQ